MISDAEKDQHIIKAIQQGNSDALAELYDRHNAWLMALAYRILQNRLDAEDLLHDVFVEVWKKAISYNPVRGTVSSWLAVKTRSRALDRLRALKNLKKHSVYNTVLDAEHGSTTSLPQEDNSCVVDHHFAKKMLEQLNPAQRTVIELSYFRGFSCQEISTHCQMPLGTVKSHLLRAMQALRKEFKRNEELSICQ
jgi:RNA polymerase sigma-70 factor (ECF subfamily)